MPCKIVILDDITLVMGYNYNLHWQLPKYVTGSVKTGHNPTSLNLQYNALNTTGELLAYYIFFSERRDYF